MDDVIEATKATNMTNMATTTTTISLEANISTHFITLISTNRHACSATPFPQSTISTPQPSSDVSESVWIDMLAVIVIVIFITALLVVLWSPFKRRLNAGIEHNDDRMRSLPQEQEVPAHVVREE